MSKQEKSQKSAFVIKLSTETLQKLSEEEEQKKNNNPDTLPISLNVDDLNNACEDVTQKYLKVPTENESCNTIERTNDKNKINTDDKPISDPTAENNTGNIVKSSEDSLNQTSWGEYAAFVSYEGEKAIYTDPSTQQKYTWNNSKNAWDPITDDIREYSYENDTHIYTEADGSKFFWDIDKNAWIPKVDDDFLAMYQMSYGFVDNAKKDSDEKGDLKAKELQKKSDLIGTKRKNEPQWFEPSEETNTKVYVSNLPLDITEEEFVNLMQKCGLVERDPSTQKMRIKMYVDKEQNCFKGDALCTYIKIESVDLALKLLDGSDYKGHKIKVEKAHFQLKGEYNPALKPKKKKKKELEKIKKMQQKLFDWRPEKFIGERSKHERVVIVKNLFHPSDFDKEVQLILDYQQDLREESSKCGDVRKVVIYDRHPEGVAQITMKEPEQADAVVQLINGRWFGKRQITAEIWDGRTKFRIAETDADISQRINKWEKFLEGEENKEKESNKNAQSEITKKDDNNKSEQCVDNNKQTCSDSTSSVECQTTVPNPVHSDIEDITEECSGVESDVLKDNKSEIT